MGSINFYHCQKTEVIDCALILDLIGHDIKIPGMEPFLFITGMESHQQLETILLQAGVDERIRVVAG